MHNFHHHSYLPNGFSKSKLEILKDIQDMRDETDSMLTARKNTPMPDEDDNESLISRNTNKTSSSQMTIAAAHNNNLNNSIISLGVTNNDNNNNSNANIIQGDNQSPSTQSIRKSISVEIYSQSEIVDGQSIRSLNNDKEITTGTAIVQLADGSLVALPYTGVYRSAKQSQTSNSNKSSSIVKLSRKSTLKQDILNAPKLNPQTIKIKSTNSGRASEIRGGSISRDPLDIYRKIENTDGAITYNSADKIVDDFGNLQEIKILHVIPYDDNNSNNDNTKFNDNGSIGYDISNKDIYESLTGNKNKERDKRDRDKDNSREDRAREQARARQKERERRDRTRERIYEDRKKLIRQTSNNSSKDYQDRPRRTISENNIYEKNNNHKIRGEKLYEDGRKYYKAIEKSRNNHFADDRDLYFWGGVFFLK